MHIETFFQDYQSDSVDRKMDAHELDSRFDAEGDIGLHGVHERDTGIQSALQTVCRYLVLLYRSR